MNPLHLVITHGAWEQALRQLVQRQQGWSVGSLRWNETSATCYILVDELAFEPASSGMARPPQADWIAIGLRETSVTCRDAVAELNPGAAQQLVVVLLDRVERGNWRAELWRRGELTSIETLEVVGGRMMRLTRSTERNVNGDDPSEPRWSRTRGALREHVHGRLRQARVTLIGAGRNGSVLAFQLAALGVPQIRLVDPDVLAIENLDAMPGLLPTDVGRHKVEVLAERLLQFRPDMAVTCLKMSAAHRAVAELVRDRPDWLVTTVDSDTARLAASLYARRWLVMHCDVGTAVMPNEHQASDGPTAATANRSPRGSDEPSRRIWGDVRFFIPGRDTGCAACVGGLADVEATLYELGAPDGALRRGAPMSWQQQRAGSLITINSMTVSVAVQAWLDTLAGHTKSSRWYRIAWVPGEGIQAQSAAVGSSPGCPFCRARW